MATKGKEEIEPFESIVIRSLKYALSLLRKEQLYWPSVVMVGMASVILNEPRALGIVRTEDIDLLLQFGTDLEEVLSTLTEIEKESG